jgi:hypothetical protein
MAAGAVSSCLLSIVTLTRAIMIGVVLATGLLAPTASLLMGLFVSVILVGVGICLCGTSLRMYGGSVNSKALKVTGTVLMWVGSIFTITAGIVTGVLMGKWGSVFYGNEVKSALLFAFGFFPCLLTLMAVWGIPAEEREELERRKKEQENKEELLKKIKDTGVESVRNFVKEVESISNPNGETLIASITTGKYDAVFTKLGVEYQLNFNGQYKNVTVTIGNFHGSLKDLAKHLALHLTMIQETDQNSSDVVEVQTT